MATPSLLITGALTLKKYLEPRCPEDQASHKLPCEIESSGETISYFGPPRNKAHALSSETRVIDAEGALLLPGFMDAHVHLRYPGGEHKETMEAALKASARGGNTCVLAMPNTSPTTDDKKVCTDILEKVQSTGSPVEVLIAPAITKGLAGKELSSYADLVKISAVRGLTDDGRGVQEDAMMEKAMVEAHKLGLPILDHAEDESLSKGGSLNKSSSSKAQSFGIPTISPEAELAHVRRGIALSQKTGCPYHVLHVSLKDSVKAVAEGHAQGLAVSCEVAPHHLLLADADIPEVENSRGEKVLDPNFKMNPPLRSVEDRDYLQEAFIRGDIAFVASDHAPHAPEEKCQPLNHAPFGIVGLETSFPLLYTHFVAREKRMPLSRLVSAFTENAWKFYGVTDRGLEVGKRADMVLVDIDREYAVNASKFHSKGRNTPFEGWKLTGFPILTVARGEVAYSSLSE